MEKQQRENWQEIDTYYKKIHKAKWDERLVLYKEMFEKFSIINPSELPKIECDGKEAKEFAEWIRENEFEPQGRKWVKIYMLPRKYTTEELYQQFKNK